MRNVVVFRPQAAQQPQRVDKVPSDVALARAHCSYRTRALLLRSKLLKPPKRDIVSRNTALTRRLKETAAKWGWASYLLECKAKKAS